MTSFGTKGVKKGKFRPTFIIQGQVYHRKFVAAIFTASRLFCKFILLVMKNMHVISAVKSWLVSQLQNMLHDSNPYVKDLKPERARWETFLDAYYCRSGTRMST